MIPINEKEEKPKEQPQSFLQKMLTRVTMGAIMIGVFTLIICSSHKYIALFVGVLSIICFREVLAVRYKEVKEKNLFGFRALIWYLLFVALFMIYGKPISNYLLPQYKEDFNRFHAWITFWMFASCNPKKKKKKNYKI